MIIDLQLHLQLAKNKSNINQCALTSPHLCITLHKTTNSSKTCLVVFPVLSLFILYVILKEMGSGE